jgi:catechol 2,3-dioxygenase-like lactoylglutathione lyase family enzyme
VFRGLLAHVAMRVEDVAALAAFYEEILGLVKQETLPDGRVRLGWGTGHHAVELVPGSPGFDHFAFEIPDRGELDALAQRVDADWEECDGDHPRAAVTRDPDGHRIEFLGRVDRSGERITDSRRRPVRIQHLTLGSPQRAAMVAFYSEVVGFRVSDHMGDVFTWLRSDSAHHTLGIVAAGEPGLDHYSYDLTCWDDFKFWCDELASRGVQIGWGPGRHGPGNNLFVIFEDTAGHRVELSAEMERFWDDRSEQQPRRWEPRPETVNLWGPTPAWRELG